jgi:hypothetical protein
MVFSLAQWRWAYHPNLDFSRPTVRNWKLSFLSAFYHATAVGSKEVFANVGRVDRRAQTVALLLTAPNSTALIN